MGYREYSSKVAIRLSRKAYDRLKDLEFLPGSRFRSFDSFHFLKDGTVFFQWDDVQWYEGHDEEVDKTMNFLYGLDGDGGEFYECLRIGEMDDDEEHRSTFPVRGDVHAYEFWTERTVGILESQLGERMDGIGQLMEFEGVKQNEKDALDARTGCETSSVNR